MRNRIFKGIAYALLIAAVTSLSSCLKSDEETIVIETPSTGIPDDSQATPNPDVVNTTTNIPNINTTIDYVNGTPIIRVDMTGVKNPDGTEWIRLYGTGDPNQNVWLEVDDRPKGFDVYNNADSNHDKAIMTDVVFTVDNSGSMSEEADAIARDIVSWSTLLSNSGLNARFGVVGYDGRITGANNLTDVDSLKAYLNHGTGTTRTRHFGGNDASLLSSKASDYFLNSNVDECGVAAIRFANDLFSFRTGANRIYVNFTDEPNFPCGKPAYSVRFFENEENWQASDGTVHTVYSSNKFSGNNWNYEEQPWLISEYTGGTTIFSPSNFSGVTLESLPVTGAMENSYIIRFANVSELLDEKPHKIHITICSKDNTIRGDKTFNVTFR
jgi:hypothetical protein